MLDLAGGTSAYRAATAAGLAVGMLALVLIRSAPGEVVHVASLTPREIRQALARVCRQPGTRLGYSSHMGTRFSGTVFVVMWGVPYLGRHSSWDAPGCPHDAVRRLHIVLASVIRLFATRHPLRHSGTPGAGSGWSDPVAAIVTGKSLGPAETAVSPARPARRVTAHPRTSGPPSWSTRRRTAANVPSSAVVPVRRAPRRAGRRCRTSWCVTNGAAAAADQRCTVL